MEVLGDRGRAVDDPPIRVRRDKAPGAIAEHERDRGGVLLQQPDHELELSRQRSSEDLRRQAGELERTRGELGEQR